MTRPRHEQISIADTPYYHIVSRCVRRTFLCGVDQATGKSFEHRRQWIENRIRILSSIFGVEIAAYAVMSNHLHICIKLCPDAVEALTNKEVIDRWCCLFKGPLLVQKWRTGTSLNPAELQALNDCIIQYRKRLGSLSWFMKCLNEPIARQANKEDGCTGHFWEARYKSQPLLTEEALLSCMAYIDLNPIRAGIAITPETSDYTSIKERINPIFNLGDAIKEQIELSALIKFDIPLKPMLNFESGIRNSKQNGILYSMNDYYELVDFTGRSLREDKRGAIPIHLPPILQRLGIDKNTWLANTTQFEKHYRVKFSNRVKLRCNSA